VLVGVRASERRGSRRLLCVVGSGWGKTDHGSRVVGRGRYALGYLFFVVIAPTSHAPSTTVTQVQVEVATNFVFLEAPLFTHA
jgi:hypothetical protein